MSSLRAVHFAVPEQDRWVDADGRPVDDPDDTDGWLVVPGPPGPMRLSPTRPGEATDVLAALTPATRLGLANVHLAAINRARLAGVRASQRRIVATSDSERRRIERDLHDGAQQRLVSIALSFFSCRCGGEDTWQLDKSCLRPAAFTQLVDGRQLHQSLRNTHDLGIVAEVPMTGFRYLLQPPASAG